MKITVEINGIDTEITLTAEQIAKIEADKKFKLFEFKYPKNETYVVDFNTGVVIPKFVGDNESINYRGRYAITQKVAEDKLALLTRTARLHALAEQLGGLKEFEFGKLNYYIYIYPDGMVSYDYIQNRIVFGVTYMTYSCAVEICHMINKGKFVL